MIGYEDTLFHQIQGWRAKAGLPSATIAEIKAVLKGSNKGESSDEEC